MARDSRSYSKLPTAFRYRTAMVDGCKCKPDPWAQSEVDRHRLYALQATRAKAVASGADKAVPPQSTTVAAANPAEEAAEPAAGAGTGEAEVAETTSADHTTLQPAPAAPQAPVATRRTRKSGPPARIAASAPPRKPSVEPVARTAERPAPRVAARKPPPRPAAKAPMYGLGASGLRWPGD